MRTRLSIGAAAALMLVLSLLGSMSVAAHGEGGIAPNGWFFVDYRNMLTSWPPASHRL